MTSETAYEKILKKLKNQIDWDVHAVSCFIMSQDATMDKPTNRFDKSHVLSFHLENLSANMFKYVDEDGWDFEVPERMEDKTEKEYLLTPKGNKKTRITVMLRNIMGNKTVTPKQFRQSIKFKALLIRQTGGTLGDQLVAALDPLKLEDKDIKFTNDQIRLNFDTEKLDWIYDPSEEQKVELQKIYEEYNFNPIENYSKFKENTLRNYVQEQQNRISNSRSRLKSGENIEKIGNSDSSIQGEQKEAA